MAKMRKPPLLLLLTLCSLALPLAATPVPAPGAGPSAPSLFAACSPSVSADSALDAILGPSAQPADKILCPQSFCSTDDQCWDNCSGAASASCVNSTCQYTYPGGGGGGGGTGPGCVGLNHFCTSNVGCKCTACINHVCR